MPLEAPSAGHPLPEDVFLRPWAWVPISRFQAIRESRSVPIVAVVRKGTCEHASWFEESSPLFRATRVLDWRGVRFYKYRAISRATLRGLATLEPAESAAPPPPEPTPSEAPPETTWIEIQMVDESDAPVAGEEYRIELPDGTVRTGKLNAAGIARLSAIPKGTCKVTFPRLDADAWEAA